MQRFPVADLDRSAWTFGDALLTRSSWSRFMIHPEHPDRQLTASQSRTSVVVHISKTFNMPEDADRVFLCSFPVLPERGVLTDALFWASLDAVHSPDAWARIEALYRMMRRWLIQTDLDGAWSCVWTGDGWTGDTRVSWTPHSLDQAAADQFWKHPERVSFLTPAICTAMRAAQGLLRPNRDGTWTTHDEVHAVRPSSGHVRMEQILLLRQHQRADADLLGLDLSDLDI